MSRTESPSPRWKRIVGGFLYATFLGLVFLVATAAGWIHQSPTMQALLLGVLRPKPPETVFKSDSGLTVLLLGCDEERYYQNIGANGKPRGAPTMANGSPISRKYARADMILVAHFDFVGKKITGLSIPRDTEVRLPGYRSQKINAYHKQVTPARTRRLKIISEDEGPDMMRRAVEFALPGVKIDRVLRLDYESFQDMVNLVGGVPITIEKKMDHDDYAGDVHIHFTPGARVLDGYDSLMFVRFRHSDSDFMRQERQKQFLLSFKDAVMRDKLKLPQIFDKAKAVVGNALNEEEIASLAFFARSLPPNSIQMGQVAVEDGRGTTLRIDERKLRQQLKEFGLVTAP